MAEHKGFTKNGELKRGKGGDIIKWLKTDFDLGHGHANGHLCHCLRGEG